MALIKGTKKADYIDPTLITPGVNGGPATDALSRFRIASALM